MNGFVTDNDYNDDGVTQDEALELWRRDPVECVSELIGNPTFKEYISYIPEHVYTDDMGNIRIYDEMWTSDWWWETQVNSRLYIDIILSFKF